MANANSSITSLEDEAIHWAMRILERRLYGRKVVLSNNKDVHQFLACWFANDEREMFCALWLDVRNRLIKVENLFFGTLTENTIYPREVVKRAMQLNVASVIFAHNHPTGSAEPTEADVEITHALRKALSIVQVELLDHVIGAGHETRAFSEMGLMKC